MKFLNLISSPSTRMLRDTWKTSLDAKLQIELAANALFPFECHGHNDGNGESSPKGTAVT